MTTYDARTHLDVLLEQSQCDDTARAADTLLIAKQTVHEYGADYWTDDQRFEATMTVYRSMLQHRQWGFEHSLNQLKVRETQISRQTIEWTNRPIKVKLIRE